MKNETKKILFKTISLILIVAMIYMGVLVINKNTILNFSKKEEKIEALTIVSNFKKIAAGNGYSMAIDNEGNLWTWGINKYGELGNGTTSSSSSPIQIMKGTKFTNISAGSDHSMAIDEEGNLWTWGKNIYGQLGNGTTSSSKIPILIKSGTKFTQISATYGHSMAIDEEGNLWTWGNNEYGQLGNGTTTSSSTPIQIKSETKFKNISTTNGSSSGSRAVDNEGNLWAWGGNSSGQLGNGTTTDSKIPIKIKSNIKKVSAGSWTTVIIDNNNSLWTCGNGFNGELGHGLSGYDTSSKEPIKIKSGIKEISAGQHHNMAIDTEGNLWVWGLNEKGQLGNGTTSDSSIPKQIMKGTKFTNISAGSNHSMAIDEEGNLWTWGNNIYGQLGNGENSSSYVPIKITASIATYTVTFKDGGSTVKTETLNYGESATAPTLTKAGYTLTWDKEFTNITEDITVNTVWIANTNTSYTVEYYQQKLDKSGYELAETVPLTGTTGQTVNAEIKNYTGFTENTTHEDRRVSGEILGDGSLVLKVFYNRNSYKLTINIDGEEKEIDYIYGEQITLPNPEPRQGYTFEGWYDNEDLTGEKVITVDTSTIDPENPPTYYPKWIPNTDTAYTVEYYQQKVDKSGYELAETVPLTGTTEETVNAEIKAYLGFRENTTHEDRRVRGEILGDGSLVLKVYYDRNSYKLILDVDGETEEIEYTYGEMIALPTNKTKDGYTFEGWYNNQELSGEKVTTIDTSTIDPEGTEPTYYIKWTKNTFTVTFKDEEDGKEETRTVNYGDSVTPPNWTKAGYDPTWSANLENITEDKIINVIWVPKTNTPYNVEYYLRSTDSEVETYTLQETVQLTGTTGQTANAQIKEYLGFTENTTYAERKVSGIIAGDGSLTLKVYYTRNQYRVTLNTNKGIITSGNINSYTYGIEMILPTRITREGFKFKGWYDNVECTGEAVTKITSTDIGEKTYHAKWEGNPNIPYTIEYYGQKLTSEEYELLETVPLTGTAGTLATAPSKEIKGFTENVEYPERIPSGEIEGDGSSVLKLYYTRNTYKVTLNIEGETRELEYKYGETLTLPTDIVKEGYVFVGWYDNEELTGNPITQITSEDAEDKTLYIKWSTEEEYYITSSKYSINTENNYITKVSPNTTVMTFINNITTNGTKKVVNAKGEEVNSENLVGTGYKLQVTYKGTIYEYEIAVRGDIDGNGRITVTDLSMINQAIVKSVTLTGIKQKAADTDYNGRITVTDLSMINQAITGKIKL